MATDKVGREPEAWRTVPGYEGIYEVSDHGRVRGLDRAVVCRNGTVRRVKGRILSPSLHPKGYRQLVLARDGGCRLFLAHQIVAAAFIGPAPGPVGTRAGEWVLNHVNADKSDNRPSNLEWIQREGNTSHALENGLYRRGEDAGSAKLTEEVVVEMRRMRREEGATCAVIGARFGVSAMTAWRTVTRKTWKHLP